MNLLEVRDVSVSYADAAIVQQVSLRLAEGQMGVLVGANGCGKSSLLRSIARLHALDAGQVLVAGHDVWQLSAKQAARHIALLPQTPYVPEGMIVGNLVRYGRYPHQGLFRSWSVQDEETVQRCMRQMNVLDLQHRRLDELSGGQRQRCWIAMVLAQDTPLIELDEPTSMLDLGHQLEVLDQISHLRDLGKSVLVVLHDLSLAIRYADVLFAMKTGRIIAEGAPQQIVSPKLIEQLYGVQAQIEYDGLGDPYVVPHKRQTTAERSTHALS